jgi:uncharacterized coiled-coil protein SlyX
MNACALYRQATVTMDIHPHSGRIASIRDYLVHLSMVVFGILIALGLEQWRTAREDHAIASRALDDMRVEIAENRRDVVKAADELKQIEPRIDRLLELQRQAIEAQLKHTAPPADPPLESNAVQFPVFSAAAWDSALAMQALGKIDPELARRVARIYSEQREVKEVQRSFISVATHLDTMGARSLNDSPERMRERLGALREFKSWTLSLDLSYRRLLEVYGELDPVAPAAKGEHQS